MQHLILSDIGYTIAEKISAETIIMVGKNDPLSMLANAQVLAQKNSCITYREYLATHHFVLNNEEAICEAIGS